MKIKVIAIGKKNKGPENLLVMKYLNRIQAFGKPLGFSEIQLVEVDDRKNSSLKDYVAFIQETLNKNRQGIRVVVLDSKGQLFTSESFSEILSEFVSERVKEIFFLIGGSNGIPKEILKFADILISFGRLTYPHLLMRVMLLEQIYRATTIIANHPYHRS